jgi:hypothetical protein
MQKLCKFLDARPEHQRYLLIIELTKTPETRAPLSCTYSLSCSLSQFASSAHAESALAAEKGPWSEGHHLSTRRAPPDANAAFARLLMLACFPTSRRVAVTSFGTDGVREGILGVDS